MYVCHTNQIGSTINSQSNFLLSFSHKGYFDTLVFVQGNKFNYNSMKLFKCSLKTAWCQVKLQIN